MATAINPTPSLRAHAVASTEIGPVVRLRPNSKLPLDKDFAAMATRDPDRIHELWSDPVTGFPQNWNVGLLMGDGLMAIDIDCKNGQPGMASAAELALPPTYTQRTASGGFHKVYRVAGDVANGVNCLGQGVDVRGAGGYIVAAGSIVDGKPYTVEHDAPIAALPPEVSARLAAARERTATTAPATELDTVFAIARAAKYLREEAPLAIEGAGGDDTTFRVAAIVKDFGVSEAVAFDLMAEHWSDRCSPPWSLEELQRKVENAFAYGLSAAGSQSPAVDFNGVGEIILPPSPAPAAAARVRFLSDASVLAQVTWLLKGWLPKRGVVLLAGQSRIGKTFLLLELAGALATGGSFFGRAVRERVGVLILAAEGGGTIAPRLEALRLHRLGGIDAASLPIAWAEISDANEIGAIVSAAAVEMQSRFGLRLGLVAVDTVAAAFGVDENDAQLATSAMKALGKLATDADVLVVAVAHYGKSDGAGVRGSSAWTASADVILAATGDISETTGEVKDRKLALTKSRFAETGPIADFDLRSVNLGLDEDGDPIGAAIIAPVNTVALDPHQGLYMDGFEGLLPVAGEAIGEGRTGVARKLLREHCYSEWFDSNNATKKKRFERIERRLIDARRIERCFGPGGVEFIAIAPPVNPASLF